MTIVDRLRIEQYAHLWEGWVDGVKVADFDYYDDGHGRMWLAGAEVKPQARRQGIGRRMVEAAVEAYGEVYASTASPTEHAGDDDTRYLSVAGAALVNACVRDGIMQSAWFFNPFVDEPREPENW